MRNREFSPVTARRVPPSSEIIKLKGNVSMVSMVGAMAVELPTVRDVNISVLFTITHN